MSKQNKKLNKRKKPRGIMCEHDYKNAIQIGNVDYVCPLCKELLDPSEWFFMNSFEFIDVTPKNLNKIKQKKYEGGKKQ
ncbi:MAG: hypothetical protein A2271_05145 [Candidatus Moranbacteria bacterium RIFOXYA12_FULL_35_19]|nr:MAG: hypothetical protein UR78_C0018G0003 [Candidatus Moranbacteria bacterium GW2011_GWF2_35_39]OGI31000.1 MAG: hypothetical protein A2343_01935 [Candidatus Moranbacteria bacterium RIFOXYB12_FULL_35_8]OGI32126.1 MAG: hypothetical protein A2489_02105 [Candidatus Moranbacteria bacterium RIFOXYC12_FULL_36_13]OGI35094.1 MAG: hypothetical protein A2271_05145 [Candidatus Moranbacteria bacterium RIFOXYA12_FULL_35_19]